MTVIYMKQSTSSKEICFYHVTRKYGNVSFTTWQQNTYQAIKISTYGKL